MNSKNICNPQSKTKKALKTAVKTARIVVVCLTCLLALTILTVKILDISLYVILDKTMEPDYSLGSLIYVEDVDVDTLDVGDVITYKVTNNVVATHRIIETAMLYGETDRVFVTKGDNAKESHPEFIDADDIVGVPKFVIPKIGNLLLWVKYPPGTYISIGVGVFLILFIFFSDNIISLIDRKKKPKSKKVKKR